MAKLIKLENMDDYAKDKIEELFRVTVLETDRRVKEGSPVDTGRFRGNWQIVEQGQLKSSVSNNLPYAERLAEGWSKQAPPGWIDSIAQDMRDFVENNARQIGNAP